MANIWGGQKPDFKVLQDMMSKVQKEKSIPEKRYKWFMPSMMLPQNENAEGGDQMPKVNFNSFNNFI